MICLIFNIFSCLSDLSITSVLWTVSPCYFSNHIDCSSWILSTICNMQTLPLQCHKVYYCSPACKRADVKDHTAVCRAYITVRRLVSFTVSLSLFLSHVGPIGLYIYIYLYLCSVQIHGGLGLRCLFVFWENLHLHRAPWCRYKEERANWSAKLREPEDGCGTCGFWRDSLTPCNICQQVGNTFMPFLCQYN